jgi:methylmalonyl-CoA/ethylmalonyl-CoA epimerase
MTERELAHLGYVVPAIEPALRRFVQEGAEVLIEPTVDPIQRVSCCVVRGDGGVAIELVAPLVRGDSPVEARLKRGGGLDHICYLVDDLDAALAEERALGALVVCDPVPAVTFGRLVAFVQRRSGMVIELMGRTPVDS